MSDRNQFKQKSIENWNAAESLKGSFKNAAVNRYYYSLYQAIRYWADAKGFLPCKEHVDDVHATVAKIVGNNAGQNAKELRETVNDLHVLRVTADYRPFDVDDADVVPAVRMASAARAIFLRA